MKMSTVIETTAEVGGGDSQYLSEIGTYHFAVSGIYEGQMANGTPIDGFSVQFSVLDGTVKGQQDKQTTLTFFSPDMSKSEKSQEWSRKKQTAFCIATGLIDIQNLGGKVTVDLIQADGQQVIANVQKQDDDSKFLQLHYANIYHVDDPRAANFPKNKEALELIPGESRKNAEYFESILSSSSKSGGDGESKMTDDDLAGL